jgi:hypothetical protein
MLRAVVVWLIMPILLVATSIEVFVQKPWWAQDLVASLSEKPSSPQAVANHPDPHDSPNEAETKPREQQKPGERRATDLALFLRILLQAGGDAAYLAVILTIWLKAKDIFGNPLKINLKRYLRSPDYEGRVAFVEQFHEDFKKIVDAFAGKERVFVFIDDLDRCEVPKAAELMKAVNLLIADDPRLIFILGMDREKVAAGLAVTYESLLPYLDSEAAGTDQDRQRKRQAGLGFGHDFLQKFIQVPFRVPKPSPENYREFVETISVPTKPSTRPTESTVAHLPASQPSPQTLTPNMPEQNDVPAQIPSIPPPTPTQVQARRQRELQFGGDSNRVRAVALMVADTLGRNPRRLKQFVNLFRLQAYIVNEIGLFDLGLGGTAPITFEQLGKFVAIGLWWPELLDDFAEEPRLLGKLEELAISGVPGSTDTLKGWLGERRMERFLSYGMQKQRESYTLSNPSLPQLLHICPQRVRVAQSAKPTTSEGV